MHVRFNEALHGNMQQTTLQIKWSSICNELHIDRTPHQLFSSLPVRYSKILNVVKHGNRVKHMKNYLFRQV